MHMWRYPALSVHGVEGEFECSSQHCCSLSRRCTFHTRCQNCDSEQGDREIQYSTCAKSGALLLCNTASTAAAITTPTVDCSSNSQQQQQQCKVTVIDNSQMSQSKATVISTLCKSC